MSSRIIETSYAVYKTEAIAPGINITWNRDNTGTIAFWVEQEVTVGGVFKGSEPDTRPGMHPLRVNIMDILPRTFMVPNPNGDPIPVPCMLLMGAIKQAFDDLYSEAVNALEAPQTPEPTETPTPEPTETPNPTPSETPSPTEEPLPPDPTPEVT